MTAFEKTINVATLAAMFAAVGMMYQQLHPTKAPPPQPRAVELTNPLPSAQSIGTPGASRVAFLVSDYECPFCAQILSQPQYALLKREALNGNILFSLVDLPLSMHANAPKAAEAALCAGDQGKFWAMHDRLHAKRAALELDLLPTYAAFAKVPDIAKFKACLDAGDKESFVESEAQAAGALQVNGTPTLILGNQESGKFKGTLYPGNPPTVQQIQSWLAEKRRS